MQCTFKKDISPEGAALSHQYQGSIDFNTVNIQPCKLGIVYIWSQIDYHNNDYKESQNLTNIIKTW